MVKLTASKLYDYLQCPHKVWRDANGPQEEKIKEVNSFVKMLWTKGVAHEEQIVAELGGYLDLSEGDLDERFRKTMEAIGKGEEIIYQGVLKYENYLGIPDILKKMPDGKYFPIDIKSGSGFEGVDDDVEEGKPKKHYAVQLCFYIELLQKLKIPNTGTGKIIDIHREEVEYDLDAPMGKRTPMTWWEFYEQTKNNASLLITNEVQNKPAMISVCKLCPWYQSCKKWSRENEDLAEITGLGRSKRDIINEELFVERISDFARSDVDEIKERIKKDKDFLKGVGDKTIEKLVRRARILSITKKPVIYRRIEFPKVSYELFFDIEDDPTRDFVYMHGVYERAKGKERFLDFTAKDDTEEAEKQAFADFWKYIRSLPQDDFSAYYYSHHEKITYRKMQKLYPDVVSEEEVEGFFSNPNVIDLYQIVQKYTDWPVSSYSLKGLAQYLGFAWRDKTPSGALSIQWFNEYLEKKDPEIMKRILEYNEDDCKATMVLKDGIINLQK